MTKLVNIFLVSTISWLTDIIVDRTKYDSSPNSNWPQDQFFNLLIFIKFLMQRKYNKVHRFLMKCLLMAGKEANEAVKNVFMNGKALIRGA